MLIKVFKSFSTSSTINRVRHTSLKTITLLMLSVVLTCVALFLVRFVWKQNQHSQMLSLAKQWPYPPLPYLVNSEVCHINDWPLFDHETFAIYQNLQGQDYACSHKPPLFVGRVNLTWIKINYSSSEDYQWLCFATEYSLLNDSLPISGAKIGPLGQLTNFASNLTESRWDLAEVSCQHNATNKTFTRVIPLVQHYQADQFNLTNEQQSRVNVILLGIDSLSRLNFLRHMLKTKRFLDEHDFIPMYGYHKVGENTIPNVHPILTGYPSTYFCNCTHNDNFTFDHVPLIFNEFARRGYLTTFIEDLPGYGLFQDGFNGFTHQPTNYYLRATNILLFDELYNTFTCYQDKLELEIYWDYILDLFKAFQVRGQQSHFTFSHLSSLTHEYINRPGYGDNVFANFLEKIFSEDHQRNSLILLYSDHAIRFGENSQTQANFYEQRLPFFYMYVPDSLSLSGLNANQLRQIARSNQHQLTSHYDLHATMMHVLTGQVPLSEPFGRTLLSPIPPNRTCSQAGIPPQFCLCHSYVPVSVSPKVVNYSQTVVNYMNQLIEEQGNFCIPLSLEFTYQAFEAYDKELNESYQFVYFVTAPNRGKFEAMVRLDQDNGQVVRVEHITRMNAYSFESECVSNNHDIVQFCYCWDNDISNDIDFTEDGYQNY